jgi:hypothetical protein
MLDEWLPSSHTVVMLPAQLADYDRLDSVVRVLVAWRKQGRWLDPRRDTYLGCPKLPGVCRVDMNVDGEACRFVFVDCAGGAIRSTGTGRPPFPPPLPRSYWQYGTGTSATPATDNPPRTRASVTSLGGCLPRTAAPKATGSRARASGARSFSPARSAQSWDVQGVVKIIPMGL